MTQEQFANIERTISFFRGSAFWNGGFEPSGSRHGIAIADALQIILDMQSEKMGTPVAQHPHVPTLTAGDHPSGT